MMENIATIKHLCTGCGACAGICSKIYMEDDALGFPKPVVDSTCISCGRCINICPILMPLDVRKANQRERFSKQGCQYKNETGYYLKCYEGYFEKYRKTSASGGFCSALLIELLNNRYVDSIYCLGPTGDYSNLFSFQRVNSIDGVIANAKSAYYPVSIDNVIYEIKKRDERTAIVCLPCQATAIRALIKTDQKMQGRVQFIIGLVCGGLPGKSMLEYIATKDNVEKDKIRRVTFREKDELIRCNNCQIKMYDDNNELLDVSRYHGESFGFAYLNKIFHNDACFCCDDVFAESADVVFGDAWYDEYKENEFGTSICIVRDIRIEKMMEKLIFDTSAAETSIDRIILSQKNVYVVQQKKNLSAIYRKLYTASGQKFPENRKSTVGIKQRIKILLKYILRKQMQKEWIEYKGNRSSFNRVDEKFHKTIRIEKRLHL